MVEGFTFIIGSILINLIPKKYRNFNKLCLIGTFFYIIGMLLGGPSIMIDIPRNWGAIFITLGIALNGIGQSLIMPNSLPAMIEATHL